MSGGVVGSVGASLQLSGLAGNLPWLGFKMIWKGKSCGLLEHDRTSSWTIKKCV